MKNLNSIIDQYFSLEEQINKAFSFEGEWRAYPFNDVRNMYWKIDGDQINYFEEPITEEILEDGANYSAEIKKGHVYRKDGLVLIVGDTNCDFNVFSFIFDEAKEYKE